VTPDLRVFPFVRAGGAALGTINTQGAFPGFLAAVTRGAAGSKDPAPQLTARFLANALGMATARTDPAGFIHVTEYDDVAEVVREIDPVRFETRYAYDEAGRRVHRTFDRGGENWAPREVREPCDFKNGECQVTVSQLCPFGGYCSNCGTTISCYITPRLGFSDAFEPLGGELYGR
jgi:YD repeat-containing protein